MTRKYSRRRSAIANASLIVMIGAGVTAVVSDARPDGSAPARIGGPYGALLAASTDLGPTTAEVVRLTAALNTADRPASLLDWAKRSDVSVRWRAGDTWALIEGRPGAVARALRVGIHDFRGMQGQVFYASPHQPAVPVDISPDVTGLGRIMSYTPHHVMSPPPPLEVPERGLAPAALQRAYNLTPLKDAGYTGKGSTVVVFGFDGFDQSDLDLFSTTFALPRFVPEIVGDQPPERDGETTMDLQAIHALAPDAKKVFVNARPTVAGDAPYARIAAMLEDTARRYPGAVWSFSIGWGCDKLVTAADLEPIRAAVRAAHRSGTTAFNASGDLAGLECKGGQQWSSAPSDDDAGLDAVASLPEMTSVGGTTLSTDLEGEWTAEQSWFDVPLSQGTGGGVSSLFERPVWQQWVQSERGSGKRLTPDVAAVADPFTGVKIVVGQQFIVGGGTSLAAPIWAGLTAVINQYLTERGGEPVGHLNPVLYQIPQGDPLSALRDITVGGNAVADAGPGYDLATGLGTPDAGNLAMALWSARRGGR